MDFQTPAYLIGTLSALIPLVLHLSHIQHKKHLRFSTTRFFTEAIRRAQRRLRIKQWLLLLMRMAACFLLAAALAGPLLNVAGGSLFTRGTGREVVLVLDVSYSMAYKEPSGTRLHKAKQKALEVLGTLEDGDRAGLVLADQRARVPLEGLTTNHDTVRRLIQDASASHFSTNLSRAVDQAAQLFSPGTERPKEIYCFTDAQRGAWPWPEEEFKATKASANLFVVNVAEPPTRNLVLADCAVGAGVHMPRVPIVCKVHVRNPGTQPETGFVALTADGRKAGSREVTVPGGTTRVERFVVTFDKGGRHALDATLSPDALEADNHYFMCVNVMDHLPVLIVNGSPGGKIPRLSETRFLETALRAFRPKAGPKGSAGDAQTMAIRSQTITPDQMVKQDFAPFEVVILANVAKWDPASLDRLEEYVDAGGALLVFLGPNVDAKWYNTYLAGAARKHHGLMPGTLGAVLGNVRRRSERLPILRVLYRHPILERFKDPANGDLTKIKIFAAYDMNVTSGRTLVALQGKRPLLVEKPFGRGRVLVFTSTCDVDWSLWPLQALYVAMLDRMVRYLAQPQLYDPNYLTEQLEPVYRVGDVKPIALGSGDASRTVRVLVPGQRPILVKPEGTNVQFEETYWPGVYQVEVPGAKGKQVETFAVNLANFESTVVPIKQGELRARLPANLHLTMVGHDTRLREAAEQARHGIGLWDKVLLLVLVLVLVEPFLANLLTAITGARGGARGALGETPEPAAA